MTAPAPIAALREAFAGRPAVLARAIAEGGEVVGTFTPLAPPVEIIEAAGARPWRIVGSTGADADLRGMGLLGRDTCSFCRSVVGRAATVPPPVTCVASGTACDRLRRAADAWPDATGLPVYAVSLPRTREDPGQREETAGELRLLARELAARTGVEATDDRLRAAIARGNRVRAILAATDGARAGASPRLTGREFLDVVRASHALDSETFLALAAGLPEAIAARAPVLEAPLRLLLVGPTLPDGAGDVVGIAEGTGGAVIAGDLTDSGTLGYGGAVAEDGDPFLALADHVLAHPILAAPLRPVSALRAAVSDRIRRLAPDGVLFRGVPFCRPWNAEAANLRDASPVPFLDVRVDGAADGQLRTRVEAFVETLAARRARGGGR